jgi:hypothetical protein
MRGEFRLAARSPVVLLWVGGSNSATVEVAASPPTVRRWSELALQLHQAPDPAAIGADVGRDVGGRLTNGGQVDAEQLCALLQRRRDRPAQVWVVPSSHRNRLSNGCSGSNQQCYRPRPDGLLGHIGGTEHRPARVNSGQSC